MHNLIPEQIKCSPAAFDALMALVENPPAPNQALIDLMARNSRWMSENIIIDNTQSGEDSLEYKMFQNHDMVVSQNAAETIKFIDNMLKNNESKKAVDYAALKEYNTADVQSSQARLNAMYNGVDRAELIGMLQNGSKSSLPGRLYNKGYYSSEYIMVDSMTKSNTIFNKKQFKDFLEFNLPDTKFPQKFKPADVSLNKKLQTLLTRFEV